MKDPTPDAFDRERRQFMGAMALSVGATTLLGQAVTPAAAAQAAQAPAQPQGSTAAPAAASSATASSSTSKARPSTSRVATPASAWASQGPPPTPAMNVVMGYIQEDQVEPAMKLFKAEQKARVIAIRHDVTDREGWTTTLAAINAMFGNLHLLVNNAGIKTLRQANQVDARGWGRRRRGELHRHLQRCGRLRAAHARAQGRRAHRDNRVDGRPATGRERRRLHGHQVRGRGHHGSAARGAGRQQHRNVGLRTGGREHRQYRLRRSVSRHGCADDGSSGGGASGCSMA